MKKQFWMILLLCFIGSTAFAQIGNASKPESDLTAKVPIDKKVRVGKLDNGFTYYIRNNKKPENRVHFRLVTNAGSILEDEDQQGLAHFCEHMAFNGTEHYKGNEMINELQKNGIEFGRGINAWTSFDETVYYVELPADDPAMIEMGFKILDGWAGKLLFDQEEIEKERGVIHEEWRMGLGADDRMRKITWPIMLKDSRYAERLPIGTEKVITTFERESIVRFYKDWYRPDLQAIVIVGDVNVDEMEAKIKQYFSGYSKKENPRVRPEYDIPNNVEPLIAIATDKEATSPVIEVFWKHEKAPQGTVGDYRQMIVRNLINGMLSSRFAEMCENSASPMIAAGAYYSGFLGRNCDAFTVYTVPKENRFNEAAETLLTEMKRIDQHGFLQAELDRQKEELLSTYTKMAKEANKTNSVNFANEYTNHYLQGEVIPGILQEWKYAREFIPSVTIEEVNAMVKSWITDENMVFYCTAPEKENYKVTTQAEAMEIINKTKNINTEPWVDNYKDEPLYSKVVAEANATVTKTNSAFDYTEYTCPNGIRFIVKKTDYKADEILISSYGDGGYSLYSDEEVYLAMNAAPLIDDAGIAQFSNSQLQKKLKGKQLQISPYIGELSQGFSGSCSPKDLETTLQLINLYYEAPRKDQENFNKNIEQTRNQLKFIKENPQVVLLEKYMKTAFPNDKRTVYIPTEEDINKLNLDRIYEIYTERFADASNQTFFFVGNISDSDIPLIAKYINNLPTNGKQKNEKWVKHENPFCTGTPRETVYKGTDNQGMMIVSGEVEGFEPTFKNRIIIQELSDAMTITALEIIREEMGGTYSPSVSVSYTIRPESKVEWMFFIACNPDKMPDIEKAIEKIIKQYIKKGPSKETLAKVHEQMIINRENAKQGNGFWMGQISGSYQYNENRDELISNYDQMVKSVTAKDIKAAAAKFLNMDNYITVMLKPEAAK